MDKPQSASMMKPSQQLQPQTIIRWSMRSLAELSTFSNTKNHHGNSRNSDSGHLGKETARILARDVTHRLARQLSACSALVQRVQQNHQETNTTNIQQALRNLQTLEYLHQDTYKLCQQVSEHSTIFDRWSPGDQHSVKAVLKQIEARHASSLERWVDVLADMTTNQTGDDHRQDDAVNWEHDWVIPILEGLNGIQLLCHHFDRLAHGRVHGGISIDWALQDCIQEASLEATHMCDVHFQDAPPVQLVKDPVDVALTIVRPWVHHSLVEVLKNAMHATVKEAKQSGISLLPPIQLDVYPTETHVVIEIQDQGIGLPFAAWDSQVETLLFGLGRSSARQRWDRLNEQQSYAAVTSPLSSLGVGLPTSRMLMRHFGGDVRVEPGSQGGCCARIFLPRDDNLLEREPGSPVVVEGSVHAL